MRQLFTALALTILCLTAGAQTKKMAVIQTSSCYMRQKPSYEAALETQELMGTVVEIVGESRYWREVISPQPYKAWTTTMTLVEMTQEQIEAYEKAPKYIYTAEYGHMFTNPDPKSPRICDLVGGDVLRVVEREVRIKTEPELYVENEVKILSGLFVHRLNLDKPVTENKEEWVEAMLPSGTVGWVKKADVRRLGDRINAPQFASIKGKITSRHIEGAIAEAEKLIGVPYLWGGMTSKGVDCSGLVRICFIMNDILLPRNASQQVNCGLAIEIPVRETQAGYTKQTALQAIANLKRGDLVFFGNPETLRVTHVGIYLGNGKIIHSSHLVRVNSLVPGEADYYEGSSRLIKACRLSY